MPRGRQEEGSSEDEDSEAAVDVAVAVDAYADMGHGSVPLKQLRNPEGLPDGNIYGVVVHNKGPAVNDFAKVT